jgi:methionine synthase II (cobalamin-independent)
MVDIKPFTTTGIGSMPFTQASQAVELALQSVDIPFWPQLPALGFREQMIPQYAEGMPGIRFDLEEERVWVERNEEEIARFYETSAELPSVAISEDFAKGFYAFINRIKTRRFPMLKGHITGPLTFTLGLKDKQDKAIYYDEELRELALMLLKGKARWQIQQLKQFADDVIIFIDEPILSALGSTAYMGVSNEEISRIISEIADSIIHSGGIPGIHCCGRADWPLVLGTSVRILNFDVYGFGGTFGLYPEEATAFFERGGILAWGIVPTGPEIAHEDGASILRVFNERKQQLIKNIPEDLLMNGLMLSPSCGTGSRSSEETMKVFQILMDLKEELT